MAGVAAAWTADLVPGRRAWRSAPPTASWYSRAGNGLTAACALIGAVPDLDLVFHIHRTFTHSAGAVIFVGLFAAALAANAERPIARVALMCAGAYATHLLLDWLAADTSSPYGIQVMWPFSDGWYISGWNVFRQTARRHVLTASVVGANLRAVVQEIAILGPLLVGLWLVRVKALAGLSSEIPDRDHPPE